jgi:hypothetical protein
MAGLAPAIHVFFPYRRSKDVDTRHKAGHDVERVRPARIVYAAAFFPSPNESASRL